MKEFTTKSGAECVITSASFKDATLLRTVLLSELKEKGFEIPQGTVLNVKDIKNKLTGENISVDLLQNIFNIVVTLDTSEKIYKQVFKCLERCTYDKEKITEAIFENEDVRADYFEIFANCIVENIRPFLKSLLSAL